MSAKTKRPKTPNTPRTSRASARRTESAQEVTKSDTILKLLRGPDGASIRELVDATGWQAHSVRGFMSGTVSKRMGLDLKSEKSESGERRYRIAARERA